MNYKIFFLMSLAAICFINNLLINFDTLQEISEKGTITVVLIDKATDEKPINYFKNIYRYLVYYIFFYDPYEELSIFQLITIGG